MSHNSNKKIDWPPPPKLEVRLIIQPALFHACEWHLQREPAEGTLVSIDITRSQPTAAPAPTRPGEFRRTPAYILVKREASPAGEHIRTYGKIVAVDFKNFEEASHDASERNRTYISNEDRMAGQREYRQTYDLEQISELQAYAQAGLLLILPDQEEILRQALRDWQDQDGPHAPEDHLMVADGEAMTSKINLACQLQRRANDESTAFGRIELSKPNFQTLYKGDCVLISGTYHETAVRNHRGIILPSSNREDLVVGLDDGTVAHIRGHEVSAHVKLGYALAADQAQDHSAEYAYVVVEHIDQRPPDASYKYSHDPTCTNIYVEHDQIKADLQQLAEWGTLHGELVRMHWQDKHAISQRVHREVDQLEQSHDIDRDLTQER